MCINKSQKVTLTYACLLLCLQVPHTTATKHLDQALLHGSNNGNLYFEAATDQNITFRLMGEAAALLLNDVDIVSLLQRRRQAAAAQSTRARQEPLSLDALKEQFRGVQRDLRRLARWLSNMHGTPRNGLTQRVLRRDLQRVQVVGSTLATLEANLAKDECLSSPCKNGGTCYDAYKSFHCDCSAGWQGTTCEDDVNECRDLASTDLAACMNDAQCINTPGSYRCVCRKGFSGTHCRLRHNACLTNQSAELCGSHGTCLPSGNDAGYVCICDQGWTWADTNVSIASASPCTRDVDECEPKINPCHNECINLPGSFRCGACPPGYTGDGKYCRDINECDDGNNGGCSQRPSVSCINTEGSYRCGRCPPGWTGDGRSCTETKSNSCNGEQICHARAQCEYISGTVVCTCPAGTFGHGYGADGCSEDPSRKPCDNHSCWNNGTCVHSGRGTSCICQPGYTGPLCASADACHPNPCQNAGTCRLLPGNQHQCNCPAGYTGNSCAHLRSYCGQVLRNETGSLQFPPTEDDTQIDYQPNERCAFIIRTRRGMVLHLSFGMFDLQNSSDCTADFVQLHDGSGLTARLIGRFCGQGLPLGNGSVLSTQEQLFLWFRSDNSTQGRGFNLTWSSQPLVCGEQLELQVGQLGILRSPSYPGKARPGLDCRWQLMAPFGSRLLLRFYEINLGNSNRNIYSDNNCSNSDFLSVRDADRQLYIACQSAQPAPLHSSSNQLHIHFHTDLYRTDCSFQLHYEVVPGHPGCGGVFTEPRGQINGYMNAALCLYLIEQPKGTQIELHFKRINLIKSDECELQKLEIFDGNSDDQPLLRRFCGQPEEGELQPLISSGNVVLVRYEYALPGLELRKSFELRYNRVCSANYSNSEGGIITSPNYPNGYFENMDCSFNIQGPVHTIVQLNITDLSLSETEAALTADNDELAVNVTDQSSYLDVYLSRDQSSRQRLFKNLTNKVLISEYNQARLVFHGASNPLRHGRGFHIEYSYLHSGCGGVVNKPSGDISYFDHGNFCQWIIEAPGRKHLDIHIRAFFRLSDNVKFLNLSIYDNSTGTGTAAKLLNSYQLTTDSPRQSVKEYSDSNLLTIIVNAPNSILFYSSIRYNTVKEVCGGNSTARYGTIKSPNWPLEYGSSEDCIWIIRAPMGQRIELIVQNFTLENYKQDFDCLDDYLEIRNGDQSESPRIGRYCGDQIPPRIPSYGNALYVRFQSDDYKEDAGFYLTWQMVATGCGGKLNSPKGAIHSPHSMEGNRGALSCDWQISVAEGSTVLVSLQGAVENLCNGQLVIYDGPTTRSAPMQLNCSLSRTIMLESSSNHVLVRYDVDNESPEGIGFVLDYATNCKVRLEQLRGAIETPNFPDNYPPNTVCEWDIRAGAGSNHVHLAFSHLTVEQLDSNSCDYDHVLMSDYRNDELISERRLCSAKDLVVSSVGNRLVLRFSSDSSMQAQGFHAEYKRLGCGEQLLEPRGTFESPNAPYSVDVDCDWHIIAPEGRRISLVIQELHIETPERDCSQDALTIYAGATANSDVVLLRTCQLESTKQTFNSPANELRIRFQSSPQRARKYIKASYDLLPGSCGGFMSVSSGVIVSPGFYEPGNQVFDKDVECVWTIAVVDSNAIKLDFKPFNLTDSPNCQAAMLELSSAKMDNSDQFIERACGENPPSTLLLASSSRIRLRFKVSAGFWGRFALHYQQVCGGVFSNTEGYIRSQLDEDCDWTITGPPGSKMSLSINKLECPPCTTLGGNCTAGLRVLNYGDDVLYFNFCQEHPANIIVPSNTINIQTKGIFLQAKYTYIENSCGGNISSVRGTLSSPNYPDSYPENVECVWQIEPTAGNAIELNFEVLDIVKSEHCNADFLEIRAGLQGSLLGLYCDKELPATPLISSTKLWLKFRSQPGSSGNGFKLRWNYVHNNEITEGTNGTIKSPPTLSVRSDDESYSWRIFIKREQVVVLDFKEYNTGLQLFDGFDDTALSISIPASPWQFISSTNVLYLRTVNADFDGFRLDWHLMSSDDLKGNGTVKTKDCNELQVLVSDTAVNTISSPGYPHGYKTNLNCEWIIKTMNPTRHVYIELYDVRLEDNNECQLDYLSIQSSSNLVDWPEQLRICNSSAPTGDPIVRIDGTPHLRLQFITDSTINGTGFTSKLRSDCGANMTSSVGTILNSHLQRVTLRNDSFCEWHIEVKPGRVIDITIDYAGAANNASCPHYGLIYDGLDAGAPLLSKGKFCNQMGYATTSFRTSGPHAYIKYLIPGRFGQPKNFTQNHWNLTYREYRDCDAEVRLTDLANSYNISTPGYPYYPHPHSDCTWLVIAPPGETIAANFVDNFDLSVRHCEKEFVELYDGATMLANPLLKGCRRTLQTTRSSGNLLLVHYQTQLSEPHGGFRLNVSLSRCGGHYTTRTDTISSEHYPALGAYPKPAVCEYTITAPFSTYITLIFSDLHLPFSSVEAIAANPNSTDRIEILNLLNQRTILSTLYSNVSTFPYRIELPTNKLAIRLITVNTTSHSYRGFKLEYTTAPSRCSRQVNAASGELEILSFMGRSNRMRVCSWHITVPKGQRVRLEFLNLAEFRTSHIGFGPSHRGMLRLIQRPFSFYNDAFMKSKIISFRTDTYNGSGIIESTDNVMFASIYMSSLNSSTLRARFSSTEPSPCPPNIGNKASGTISNQELLNLSNYYCRINFEAEPGVTISFNVEDYVMGTKPGVTFMNEKTPVEITLKTTNETVSLAATVGYVELLRTEGQGLQRFRATYKRYACGGELRLAESSSIELPQMSEHFGPLECVWTLLGSYGYELNGNLSFSDSCDREYLVLSNYRTGDELGRFCRGMNQLNATLLEISPCRVLYHATQYRIGISSFQLQATRPKSLGGMGNIVRVTFQPTPPIVIDKSSYRDNMELSWEFETNAELSLRLEFKDRFFIEMAPNCSHDQLQVQSYTLGLWQTIATLCGRDLPKPLFIPAYRLRVIFRTDQNNTADGFTFVVSASCDAQLVATTALQTFNFRRSSLNRWEEQSCNFEISTETKQQLLVNVKGKSRQSWSTFACRYNYFEAYRQVENATQEQLIDKKLCPDFEINGYGRLRLHFESSMSWERMFELQYQLIGCGGNYTAPFTLRPPLGETKGNHARGLNCVWHVLAPPQHSILLRFKYFGLTDSEGCLYDQVSVFRGTAQSEEQRVARLCGNLTTPSVMIDSNQALILAVLPDYLTSTGIGFLASVHFTPNCNERLDLKEGNTRLSLVRQFQLNNTSSEDLQCHFMARAPPGYRLSIWLKQLQLNADRCVTCNSLELVDGFESNSASLGTYYAVIGNGTKIFSSTTDLLIKLSGTKAQPNGLSFELILEMERTICGQLDYELHANETIKLGLNSNNISGGYEGNIHCVYNIKSDVGLIIQMNSVQLQDLSPLTGKCLDYLSITREYVPTKYYCGQFNNTVLEMARETPFQLTFHGNSRGAYFEYDILLKPKLHCNQTLEKLDDNIAYYTADEKDIANCINDIRVPNEYYLTFEFSYVHFEQTNGSFLNVTDLKTNRTIYNTTEAIYAYLSKSIKSNVARVLSRGVSFMKIYYYSTPIALPPGCGGVLSSMEGQFSNPPYDNRNFSDCSWQINVPAGTTLQFIFTEFNMGSESNCHLDNIKFYEILPDNSERLLQTFCGSNVPELFTMSKNRIKIIARKSPNFDGTGFRLYYMPT